MYQTEGLAMFVAGLCLFSVGMSFRANAAASFNQTSTPSHAPSFAPTVSATTTYPTSATAMVDPHDPDVVHTVLVYLGIALAGVGYVVVMVDYLWCRRSAG